MDKRFLQIEPDIILLTHNHLDYTDPETLCHYLSKESEVTVLASGNAWQNVRACPTAYYKIFPETRDMIYNILMQSII